MPQSGLSIVNVVALSFVATSTGMVAQDDVGEWTIEGTPVVSIGTVDGPEEYALVNPLHGTVLSDGTIVLQNSLNGLFELRYYAADGTYLTTASRWGEGPFEFHFVLDIHQLPADSILITGQDWRFAVFGARGERIREGRALSVAGQPGIVGLAVDDQHLAVMKAQGPPMPEPGRHRDSYEWVLVDILDETVAVAGTVRGTITEVEALGRGISMIPYPFSPRPYAAAGGGRLWIGESDAPGIRSYGPDGRQLTSVRVPFSAREVTRGDRERMRDLYASRFEDRPEVNVRWARAARRLDSPDEMPYYGQLVVDRLGNLWVQEYEAPWAEGGQRWSVFARGGSLIARVTLPSEALPTCARRFQPCSQQGGILEIGADYALVSQQDVLGVEYVRLYRLRREP